MNVSGTNASATGRTGLGDVLYDKAGARPDLDLNFAKNKSFKDRISNEDLITFTRHTSADGSKGATYVDENGLVKVASRNLMQRSETVTNGNYGGSDQLDGTFNTYTDNNVIAPDGSLTAGTWTADSDTFAILYTKSDGTNAWIQNPQLYTSSAIGWNITSEWQRFYYSFTYPSQGGGVATPYILRDSVSSASIYFAGISNLTPGSQYTFSAYYKKVGTKVYYWGGQVNPGSTPTEYVRTSSIASGAPRFTYDPETLESKGLLIEQSVINYMRSSRAISGDTNGNQFWVGHANKINYDNSITNPDGSTGAAYAADSASEIYQFFDTRGSNSGAGTDTITISCFVKARSGITGNFIIELFSHQISTQHNQNMGQVIRFDPNGNNGNGALNTDVLAETTARIITNPKIEKYPNGWFRISCTVFVKPYTVDGTTYDKFMYSRFDVQHIGHNTSNDGKHYFWGAQAEVGDVLTSFIPTSGSEVTRSPDLTRIDGDNFGAYRTNKFVQTKQWQFPFSAVVSTGTTITRHADANPVTGEYDAIKATITNVGNDASVQQNISASGGSGAVPNDGTKVVFSFYARTDSGTLNLKPKLGRQGSNAFTSQSPITITDQWARYQVNDNGLDAGNTKTHYGLQILDVSKPLYTYGWQLEIVASNSSQATQFIPSRDKFNNRQSNARYVDSNGIVRKSIKNFISHSHDIDHNNSSWNTQEMGGGSVAKDPNLYQAPNGLLEASKYTFSIPAGGATDDRNHLQGLTSGFAQNDVVCASVYMKSAVVGQTQKINIAVSGSSRNLCTVTDKWQRFEIRAKRTNDNSYTFRIGIRNGTSNQFTNKINPDNTYDAQTSSIYIWGAQIEKTDEDPNSVGNVSGTDSDPDQGLITGLASELVKTIGTATGLARYSHDPETLTPTGLYLEPAATNLIPYSEDFSQSEWEKNNVSLDSNTTATTAPDGTNTASLITATGSTSVNHRLRESTFPLNTDPYTLSVFIKFNTSKHVLFKIFKNGQGTGQGNILYKRVKLNTDGSLTIGTGGSGTLIFEKYPNGWYRFLATSGSSTGSDTGAIIISVLQNDVNSEGYVANGQSLYVWGAQIENSNFATSYIKTTGQTNGVTRSADIFNSTAGKALERANGTKPAFYTINGITAFAQAQFNNPNGQSHQNSRVFGFSGGSGSFAADFQIIQSFISHMQVYQNTDLATGLTNFDISKPVKVAGRYDLNNSQLATNGTLGNLDNNHVIRSSTQLDIGKTTSSTDFFANGTIQRLIFWKTPLNDSKLQRLTS